MGTDALFHKRKARRTKDLARRKASRAPYAKVLIVCEGRKTEPNYFTGLRDDYRLNSANVEITGEGDSTPEGVLAFARARYQQEQTAGDPFDTVFCVFDKDDHAGYSRALARLSSIRPRGVFRAIASVPAFEYWLLLHYEYSTRPYRTRPGRTAAEQVLADLKKHFPQYRKGDRDIFRVLRERLETAKQHAARSLRAAERSNTDNPSTKAHQLVCYLQKIRR